jgi:hypothetical protein
MLRWTEAPVGEAIVDVVLSLNEQAQKRNGKEVATASYSHVTSTLQTFDQIGNKLDEIEQAIHNLAGHPGEYLRAMATAFRYFARSLQGDQIPYPELITNIQQLPTRLISDKKTSIVRERVDRQLTELGYQGKLDEKVKKWREDTLIAPEEVIGVAQAFINSSKAGTLKRTIELPPEDGIVSVSSIRGVFWSGYSKYTGNYKGKLTFNIDRPWTEPILAQVMTHEAYPGHQAFYCRWDYLYQQGKLPLEASYYLINSPTNALFEGGPETALHFLGWDDLKEETPEIPDQTKRQYMLARDYLDMQRIATTNACYLVNMGEADKEEAIDYMKKNGMIGEIEATNAHRFFTDPIQKSYYPSYYYGRWMVGKAYDLMSREQRKDYFRILYDTPHTTDTFIAAISELSGTNFKPFED